MKKYLPEFCVMVVFLMFFGGLIFLSVYTESDYAEAVGPKAEIIDGLKNVPQKSVDKAIMNEYQGWELEVVISSEIMEEGKIKIVCIDKKGEKNIYLVIRVIGNDENYFADFWAPKDGIYKICLVRPIPSYRRNMESKMAFFDYFFGWEIWTPIKLPSNFRKENTIKKI